jgi:hypothetical protein
MIVIFMSPRLPEENPTLQLEINMAGPAAFRGIAGYIEEVTFLMTAGTFFRGPDRRDGVAAIAAAPVSQTALGADIPAKLAGRRIAAQGAFHAHFLFWGCHFFHLAFRG